MKLLAAVVIAIVLWQVWGKNAFAPRPPVVANTGEVILYMTDWCPYCRQARTLLQEKGVEFAEVDIEKSDEGRAQYEALGVDGIPVLNVKGTIIRGFDRDRIVAALRQ